MTRSPNNTKQDQRRYQKTSDYQPANLSFYTHITSPSPRKQTSLCRCVSRGRRKREREKKKKKQKNTPVLFSQEDTLPPQRTPFWSCPSCPIMRSGEQSMPRGKKEQFEVKVMPMEREARRKHLIMKKGKAKQKREKAAIVFCFPSLHVGS